MVDAASMINHVSGDNFGDPSMFVTCVLPDSVVKPRQMLGPGCVPGGGGETDKSSWVQARGRAQAAAPDAASAPGV